MLTLSPSSAPYADLTVMLRSELKHLRGHELTLDYSFYSWTVDTLGKPELRSHKLFPNFHC